LARRPAEPLACPAFRGIVPERIRAPLRHPTEDGTPILTESVTLSHDLRDGAAGWRPPETPTASGDASPGCARGDALCCADRSNESLWAGCFWLGHDDLGTPALRLPLSLQQTSFTL
jgi:hypothetical protein